MRIKYTAICTRDDEKRAAIGQNSHCPKPPRLFDFLNF